MTAAGGMLALAGCSRATGRLAEAPEGDSGEAEVTPGEDLMQEHGVLERILLVYDEAARRIENGQALELRVVGDAAEIVRAFVEDYHEQNEERFVFPRLEKANREVALVGTLLLQHRRGREVTAEITRLVAASNPSQLAPLLRSFARMYRPHAAREDTVVFPAFRDVVGRGAYRELGEQFEDGEHARFGDHGFADTVARVAELETALAIHDLSKFTP